MGIEKGPTVGSSGEYWSMIFLNQRFADMINFLNKIMKTMTVVKFKRKIKN